MKPMNTFLLLFLALFTQAFSSEQKTDLHYGKILEIKGVSGYQYLKVDENGTTLWVAIANAPIAVGDIIGYDKQTIMHDFKSKTLHQTFKEIVFASEVYLPQKTNKPQSMKDALGLNAKNTNTADPHAGMGVGMPAEPEVEQPTKPFIKKDSYTIEEIYMWRKTLEGQKITLNAKVYKVSHQIMKLDWVHLGDGTGDEKLLTDDLVCTTASTHIKKDDSVTVTGTVVVNKDFGYGYFYKVLLQDATFEVR